MLDNISSEISKILQEAIKVEQKKFNECPPREVEFLNALKPFADARGQSSMDKVIDMYRTMSTAKNLQDELKHSLKSSGFKDNRNVRVASIHQHDSSIHEDGIYDIDTSCLQRKKKVANSISSVMLLMALMEML